MESIRVWATVLCVAAAAAGMAGIIAPSGSMGKIYRFVVSVFFLACVLVPLFQMKDIRLPAALGTSGAAVSGAQGIQSVVESQQREAVRRQLEMLVTECCEKSAGVTPRAVEVELSSESGAYGAKTIRVVVDRKDIAKGKRVVEACRSQLGLTVTVGSAPGP